MESNIQKNSHSFERSTIDVSLKQKKVTTRKYRKLFVAFGLMFVFTILAFYAVSSDAIANSFALPFIFLLACLQVVLQLFLFMHLDEKGNAFPISFIFTGVVVAAVTVAALMLLIWW